MSMATSAAMPEAEPRFLCDAMLGGLARWLRAAGYDTLLAQDESDRELLARAAAEGRHFLTCDRTVREHKAARGVALVLPQTKLDDIAELLGRRFAIDWLSRSFTRCVLDNAPLEAASAAQVAGHSHPLPDAVLHCPNCDRLYWEGSHQVRMRRRLERWQAAAGPSRAPRAPPSA
jgi:uncharacterized protein with PIN domain